MKKILVFKPFKVYMITTYTGAQPIQVFDPVKKTVTVTQDRNLQTFLRKICKSS